jgi:hypothetical protein
MLTPIDCLGTSRRWTLRQRVDLWAQVTIKYILWCCESGSGQIRIILSDPDPYKFQSNVEFNNSFSRKFQDTAKNIKKLQYLWRWWEM